MASSPLAKGINRADGGITGTSGRMAEHRPRSDRLRPGRPLRRDEGTKLRPPPRRRVGSEPRRRYPGAFDGTFSNVVGMAGPHGRRQQRGVKAAPSVGGKPVHVAGPVDRVTDHEADRPRAGEQDRVLAAQLVEDAAGCEVTPSNTTSAARSRAGRGPGPRRWRGGS